MMKHGQSTVVSELATVQHTRAAAFVLLLSVLLVVEGVSRANLYIGTPAGQWTGDLRISGDDDDRSSSSPLRLIS